MWPSGIYSGALPVTPFRTGVPREHGEMSSCKKAWKRDEEKGGSETVREGAAEELWGEEGVKGNRLETNTSRRFTVKRLGAIVKEVQVTGQK